MALRLTVLAAALALSRSVNAQQPVWAQCGGIGWTGGKTCVAGTTCTVSNPYYSQCLPGAATTATTPVATPTSTSTTPPISTVSSTTTSDPPTSTGGSAGASCPTLPATLSLVSNAKLPNPFKFAADGSAVTTKEQWACRQAEISQLFQRYELGTLPGKPSSLSASYSGTTLSITASNGGASISFSVGVSLPSSGSAPYPAIIAMGGLSIPTPAGVAVLTFNNDDMAAQTDSSSRGRGKFYTLFGAGHSASAMTAWAWGVSRIIDALETTPALGGRLDLARLAVSGCSRNGKGALVAGAFEPRIALTIPQESGSGGAGCWRISDAMLKAGVNTQTASEIVGENVWFSTTFAGYAKAVPTLPFDHHMLAALIAPRALLVIDNTGIDWLGPQSVFGCMKTANKVWQALGVPDRMGVSQVGNHGHCAFPASEQGDLDAFVNKFLKGQNTNTAFVKTDGANQAGFVDANWVDWSVPTLT